MEKNNKEMSSDVINVDNRKSARIEKVNQFTRE